MKKIRQEKLNAEFLRGINEILSKRVKDHRLTELYTLTSVSADAEFQTAKVYVSILSTDDAKAAATFDALQDAAPLIRQVLSKEMHIRTVPKFEFVLDKQMEYGQKIDMILSELQEKK